MHALPRCPHGFPVAVVDRAGTHGAGWIQHVCDPSPHDPGTGTGCKIGGWEGLAFLPGPAQK